MAADMDVEDTWSEASEEIEEDQVCLQPRAYQIEMFQESMKQNTIVTVSFVSGFNCQRTNDMQMETGSGKTMMYDLYPTLPCAIH